MAFIDLMKEKAKQDVMTIILPESNDKRTLIAAAQVLKEKTADLIMIGKEEKIMDGAHWLEVDLTGLKVVDPDTDPKFDHYAETLFKLREHLCACGTLWRKRADSRESTGDLKDRLHHIRRYDGKRKRR